MCMGEKLIKCRVLLKEREMFLFSTVLEKCCTGIKYASETITFEIGIHFAQETLRY